MPGTHTQKISLRQILIFDLLGGHLDINKSILGEAAGCSEQESAMLRAFGQKAFHQLEAEGQGLSYQVRIIV